MLMLQPSAAKRALHSAGPGQDLATREHLLVGVGLAVGLDVGLACGNSISWGLACLKGK